MKYQVTHKKTKQNLGIVTEAEKTAYEGDPVSRNKYTYTAIAEVPAPTERKVTPPAEATLATSKPEK